MATTLTERGFGALAQAPACRKAELSHAGRLSREALTFPVADTLWVDARGRSGNARDVSWPKVQQARRPQTACDSRPSADLDELGELLSVFLRVGDLDAERERGLCGDDELGDVEAHDPGR